ncbi:tRNA pseudouridine(38-40) synthase TruA [Candidatus Zinderia endosymbiont of Aphrophora alni]|uniref:tRNA pseudouridine(38-40) synthase TruA n=1 Tax=Candidatus Zinderia endosymbiont of Aphrophora alni TaxID=3077951 RepID=UPI0030CFC110
MIRIVLSIQYDGNLWHGWQKQKHKLTIQDKLEEAIKKLILIKINVICSSRTDTGVHALEQIAHFDTNIKKSKILWLYGINHFLPPTIVINWVHKFKINNIKEKNFHSRFSAISRIYQYILYNNILKSPFLYGKVGWTHKKLNINLMNNGAKYLIGLHDFSNLKSSKCQSKTSIKNIKYIKIYKYKKIIIFIINANSFLYHMVRNIIGLLINVGNGLYKPIDVYKILKKKKKYNIFTFMPYGLYLTKINYSNIWNLPKKKNINFFLNIYKFLVQ